MTGKMSGSRHQFWGRDEVSIYMCFLDCKTSIFGQHELGYWWSYMYTIVALVSSRWYSTLTAVTMVEMGSGHLGQPGHVLYWSAGLTWKCLGLIWILHWITCFKMASGLDQSNELSMLDGDNGNASLDSLEDILRDWLYN